MEVKAVKNWFIVKNHLSSIRNKELTVVCETQKAVLVKWKNDYGVECEHWIPKNVITDKWEKDTSGFGYHDYLVGLYHKAYDDEIIENYTIRSGRNTYRGDAFVHQLKNDELEAELKYYGIDYMTREAWNNR